MAFDQPYIPNIGNALAQAGPAYELGATMRQQNALSEAGAAYTQGNTKGAINTLGKAGLMDQAMALEDRLKAAAKSANDEQLAKAQRTNELLGNLALRADTPEKWTAAFQAAKQAGLDVDQWEDFGTRDFVLAQAGRSKDAIDAELNARKAEISAVKAATPKPKTFGFKDIEKLSDKGVQRENVQRYGQTFDPNYAGYGRGGETMMSTARNLPFLTGEKTEEAAAWWQDYDRYKNVVRNELFGSALTEQEKAEFDKADINPNMSPEAIQKNIARQEQAINSALRKNADALLASGYSQEAVEGALGVSLDELQAQPQAAPSGGGKQPVQVKSIEEAMKLPSGTPFLTPDGRQKVRP